MVVTVFIKGRNRGPKVIELEADETVQWVKHLLHKPDSLSLILGIHIRWRERPGTTESSSDLHTLMSMDALIRAHKYTILIVIFFCEN